MKKVIDFIDATAADVKQAMLHEVEMRDEAREERKFSFWTSVSMLLAFIAFFIVGGAVAISSLARAISD